MPSSIVFASVFGCQKPSKCNFAPENRPQKEISSCSFPGQYNTSFFNDMSFLESVGWIRDHEY